MEHEIDFMQWFIENEYGILDTTKLHVANAAWTAGYHACLKENQMNEINIINKMQTMCEESCSPDQFDAWESLKAHLMMVRKNLSRPTTRVADVSAASHGKALCCCIPDQTKLDVQCQKSPEFEIWFGVNPSPDDNTLVCAEHLVEMLDDSDQFTILRYVAAERR